MKRNLEDETVNLIGRSAAERSLDRFYNRQRKELDKLKTKEDEQGEFLKFKKVLPFPEPVNSENEVKTESVDSEPKVKSEPVKKTLKEVLNDLSKKHIPNRNKFAKSVDLLSKLSNSYFRESYRTEIDVSYLDFFSVFVTVNDVFVKEFSGSVPKDCLDEKSSLVSLTQVLDYLLESNFRFSNVKEEETPSSTSRNKTEENPDNNQRVKNEHERNVKKEDPDSTNSGVVFSSEERLFLNFLKLSFGYSSSLWYENDPFAFHGVVNTLKRFFEDFLEDIKFGFVLSDINRVKNDPFELPTRDQLLSLQLKSFVRTLGVVFSFFDYPWSKSSLTPLFSLVYLKRNVFDESDQSRISAWQSHINSKKTKGVKSLVVQGIGETSFEVKDGREERITTVHGSQKWSDRQLRL